jgi:hypothetical protein
VSVVEPNDAVPLKWPVTRACPAPSCAMARGLTELPPVWTTQLMAPDAVTCITKVSRLPRLVSDVEPNDALPLKSPVTRAPPAPSYAMPLLVTDSPPAWTTQSMAPDAVTCIT